MVEFPDKAWFKRWADELEGDQEYADASEGWGEDFNGGFIFTIRNDDNLPKSSHYCLDLLNDTVQSISEIDDPDDVDHGFRFSADYNDWVELISKGYDPIEGILSGTYELDGEIDIALEYNHMASHMFTLASQIDTEFKY